MLNICCLLKVLYFSVLIKIINNSTKNKQMATQHFIQIECISVEQFKNELLTEIKQLLETYVSQQTEQDEILSREQTAELLKISLVTLWKWTNNDIIPAYRIGKKVRYKKSEVLASLKPKNRFNF